MGSFGFTGTPRERRRKPQRPHENLYLPVRILTGSGTVSGAERRNRVSQKLPGFWHRRS
ncbi:hypothetical protein [Kamptonema formosum]|uniref:hypothetical protein n=1 Tax=Kamptonema formosum TaxID=331992 RepID=UPI000346F9C9|nr:hypothetical protein [Oscillatoria sp. PCC 10802]